MATPRASPSLTSSTGCGFFVWGLYPPQLVHHSWAHNIHSATPATVCSVYDAAIAELALEHLDACSAVSGTSAGTPATPPRRIEDVSFSSGGDLASSLDGGSIMMSLSLSGGDCSSSNLLSMSLGLSSPAITPCLSAASSAADWAWDGCAPAAGATPAAAAS